MSIKRPALLAGLVNLEGIAEQFEFYDTMPFVNTVLRIGGWLSRAASLPALGRPLVIAGIRKDYRKIGSFVETIRSNLKGNAV
jgi:hypothetical protein